MCAQRPRIPDQQTLKDRMIGYGDNQKDDPNDHPGVARGQIPDLYKLTEEDLVYLFDQNAAGDPQYQKRDGSAQTLTDEQRNEALDITDVREEVEYRDAFGRRYDPKTTQDGQPGPLEGGYYYNGDQAWTRLRYFAHDGSTRYRYAKVIAEDAGLHTVYNMEEVLKAAVPHGQAIRTDRFNKYQAAGNAIAQSLQDQTFVFTERDQTYQNLFEQAAGQIEGGREFTGYQMTYDDYRKNADAVYANELTQRQAVQEKEWALREQELVDRYNAWEARIATIMERGRRSWDDSESRFLQSWRQWERDFDQKEAEGKKKWDEAIADHFKKKNEWETETRAKASEATIEKVLGDQVQALNRQIRAAGSTLAQNMPALNEQGLINDAIQKMRNEMPSGGEKLKAINAGIANFNVALSTAELIKGNFQNEVNSLAQGFRAEMKAHQQSMKILANVKVFEQYRQMIVQFKQQIEVQNRAVANQTAAAAMAQGYVKLGDTFVKKGQTSSALGFVNAYKWYDVDSAMDERLSSFNFTPMDGDELVGFLENKNEVEVEAYFYTQKLAVQAAIQEIQGRGTKEERETSRDAKVIGLFSAWVGSPEKDQTQGHSDRLLGGSFDSNLQARSFGVDILQAGFGELGAIGQRPGGAALGFYPQLKHMGGYVAKADAQGKADMVGTIDPVSNLINQFNPAMMVANAAYNIETNATFKGYDRKQMIIGEMGKAVVGAAKTAVKVVTGALTNALMAVGSIVGPAGTVAGAAIGVGIALVANTVVEGIEIDEQGRGGFRMNAQKWATVIASSLATAIPGSFIWAVAAQAALTIAQAGFDYDEKGNQKGGWKMTGEKWDRVGADIAINAASSYAMGGMDGKGGIGGAIKGAGIGGAAGGLLSSVASSGIATMAAYGRMQITGSERDRAAYIAMGEVGMERLGGLAMSTYEAETGTLGKFGSDLVYKSDTGKEILKTKIETMQANKQSPLAIANELLKHNIDLNQVKGGKEIGMNAAREAQRNNGKEQARQILAGLGYRREDQDKQFQQFELEDKRTAALGNLTDLMQKNANRTPDRKFVADLRAQIKTLETLGLNTKALTDQANDIERALNQPAQRTQTQQTAPAQTQGGRGDWRVIRNGFIPATGWADKGLRYIGVDSNIQGTLTDAYNQSQLTQKIDISATATYNNVKTNATNMVNNLKVQAAQLQQAVTGLASSVVNLNAQGAMDSIVQGGKAIGTAYVQPLIFGATTINQAQVLSVRTMQHTLTAAGQQLNAWSVDQNGKPGAWREWWEPKLKAANDTMAEWKKAGQEKLVEWNKQANAISPTLGSLSEAPLLYAGYGMGLLHGAGKLVTGLGELVANPAGTLGALATLGGKAYGMAGDLMEGKPSSDAGALADWLGKKWDDLSNWAGQATMSGPEGFKARLQGADFVGQAAFEVASTVVPVSKLGLVAKLGSAGRATLAAVKGSRLGQAIGKVTQTLGKVVDVTGDFMRNTLNKVDELFSNRMRQIASDGGKPPAYRFPEAIDYRHATEPRVLKYLDQMKATSDGVIPIKYSDLKNSGGLKTLFEDMKQIQQAAKREVSFVKIEGGQYRMKLGEAINSGFLPQGTNKLIAHTHPPGGLQNILSGPDIAQVWNMRQKSTWLLPAGAETIHFGGLRNIDNLDRLLQKAAANGDISDQLRLMQKIIANQKQIRRLH